MAESQPDYYKEKNGLEDLKKARVYLTRLIGFESVDERKV